jgi:uncharacterized protein YdhG (YjbR/CyaY superfamily)
VNAASRKGQTVKSRDVDAYIAGFPPRVRTLLAKVRSTIRKAAPGATEVISYRIPAFRMKGMLVYFAGFRQHIGLYPPVRGNAALEKAVRRYAGPKGNLKFSCDETLPLALIARIVRHRVKQDRSRSGARKGKK